MDKLSLNIKVKCIGALLIKWTRFFLKNSLKNCQIFISAMRQNLAFRYKH